MAPVAGIGPATLAHGGFAGAIAESLIVIAVVSVLLAVWIRERRAGHAPEGLARLRDEDEPR